MYEFHYTMLKKYEDGVITNDNSLRRTFAPTSNVTSLKNKQSLKNNYDL